MIDIEEVARKYDNREGYKVVAYREVGLPIFRLNSLLTLQESGKLGALEEFLLRSLQHKVDTVVELERFLGVPAKVITNELGQLSYEDAISLHEVSPAHYSVTKTGQARLSEEGASRLVQERINLYYDGITRKVTSVDLQALWSNRQLIEISVPVVPPTPRRPPRPSEVDLLDVNHFFSLIGNKGGNLRKAVRFDAIMGNVTLYFRRAIALVFKSDDGKKIVVAFVIEGRLSEEHEVAYARSSEGSRSALFNTMFDADRRRREIQKVGRELRHDLPGMFTSEDDAGRQGRAILTIRKKVEQQKETPGASVRVLSVYEHPPILKQAFTSAQLRILLISPWIRANVVDDEFLSRLVSALERNVEVTIGYGIGRDDRERLEDKSAKDALAALMVKFQNFRLINKGNTHAKVLIVDSQFFVTTSFNWLSFRGDPDQPMREEEGTMVTDANTVNSYYDKLLARMG